MATGLDMILSLLEYPKEIEFEVRGFIEGHQEQMSALAQEAYRASEGREDEIHAFPIYRKRPLTRLSVITYLLIEKYEEYKALGVSEQIIGDTFGDVTLRAKLFYAKHGRVGLDNRSAVWFRHIMNKRLFQIGVLQFQFFDMLYLDKESIGEEYMTFSQGVKKRLAPNTPVLNVHIPVGADLRPERISDSFNRARDFFKKHFPQKKLQAFVCYSWLLYPRMQTLLGGGSNIGSFYRRFEIIGECNDAEQALENLFGVTSLQCKNVLPQETSLQRAALHDPSSFGIACGIIMI